MAIAKIGGIPVYNATIPDEECGMMKISLVDDPAVMSNFLAFKNERQIMTYAIQDEDKHLVLGAVMRANFPIYRRDDKNGEFYIMYSAETIRQMAEKYLADDKQNNVNLMHQEGSDVEGVNMVQWFIKDSAKGINPEGIDAEDGSLIAEFHVTNDDVWDEIKNGTYKGFSLEGVFGMIPNEETEQVDQIVDSLDGKFNKIINKFLKTLNMSKMSRFKANLLKLFAEFANITTDKGILSWDGDDEIKVEDSVYLEDADGNKTPAPDGEYKTDDAKIIVVAEGKVTEIKDAETDPAPAADPADPTPSTETFAEVETDNGTLIYEGEGDLTAGVDVFVEQNGERVPAPNGDYKTSDGKVIKVADGKVSEITDPAAEVAPVEDQKMSRCKRIMTAFSESYDEKVQKIQDAIKAFGLLYGFVWEAGDDYAIYCYWTEDDWDDHFKRFDVSWDADGNAVVTNPVDVKRSFVPVDAADPAPAATDPSVEETLRKENEDLRKEVTELKKLSGAKPAHEEVLTTQAFTKTGNKRLDTLARILNA